MLINTKFEQVAREAPVYSLDALVADFGGTLRWFLLFYFGGTLRCFFAFLFSPFLFHLPRFLSFGSCVFRCFHVFSLFLGFSFMTLWHLLLAALPRFQTLAEKIFKKTVSIIWADWYAQKDTWCKGVNQRHYAKLIIQMSSSMFNKVEVKINEAWGHKVCQEMTALGWFNSEKEASFDKTQQSIGHLFLLRSMFMQK